jgi:DNA-binding GntR family transcriptional regulator
MNIQPIKNSSKSQEVFEALRQAIFVGDLEPGDQLREAHLARQFSVSQVPVREALLQLERVGLVVRVPDKGTTVTKLSRSEILELLEVRIHLEDLAFNLAAPRLDDHAIRRLKACVADIEKAVANNDHYSTAEADLMFHRAVWSYSGNRVLTNMLEQLCVSVFAFVSLRRHKAGEHIHSSKSLHTKLLNALKAKKANAISAAIRDHLDPARAIPTNILD